MNDFDLKVFLTIVNKGTFSSASEALALSQPALSKRVKALEDEIGYSLFARNRGVRQTELTREGKLFLNYASQITELWDCVLELGGKKQPEILRISAIESVLRYSARDIFRAFLIRYPEIHISMTSHYSRDAYRMVDQDMLDFAVVGKVDFSKDANVAVIPLYMDPWVMVCDLADHYPDTIDPASLDPTRQLLFFPSEKAGWHYIDSSQALYELETNSVFSAELFAGGKWAVVPASIAASLQSAGYCHVHQMTSAPPDRVINALMSAGPLSDTIKKLLSCIHEELLLVPHIKVLY